MFEIISIVDESESDDVGEVFRVVENCFVIDLSGVALVVINLVGVFVVVVLGVINLVDVVVVVVVGFVDVSVIIDVDCVVTGLQPGMCLSQLHGARHDNSSKQF